MGADIAERQLRATSRRMRRSKMPLRKPDLLNHLISPDEERGRHGKPKRFGGFEVYNEFKFGRLDDWR